MVHGIRSWKSFNLLGAIIDRPSVTNRHFFYQSLVHSAGRALRREHFLGIRRRRQLVGGGRRGVVVWRSEISGTSTAATLLGAGGQLVRPLHRTRSWCGATPPPRVRPRVLQQRRRRLHVHHQQLQPAGQPSSARADNSHSLRFELYVV